jgi:hypothetical protein
MSILRCISVGCKIHFDINFGTSRLFCATRYWGSRDGYKDWDSAKNVGIAGEVRVNDWTIGHPRADFYNFTQHNCNSWAGAFLTSLGHGENLQHNCNSWPGPSLTVRIGDIYSCQ